MFTSGQDNCVIVNQITSDQGQIVATDLNMMEMTEVEYTHLQHILQTHMESQSACPDGPGDVRLYALGSPALHQTTTQVETEYCVTSSSSTASHDVPITQQGGLVDVQEIKMVLVSDAEKTPTTCGEVPLSVLAKIIDEVDPPVSGAPVQPRPSPPARVRLENRFHCSDIPQQQDAQSTALSNFLTMVEHSTEAKEAAVQKCMRSSDRSNPIDLSNPYAGTMFNSIASLHGQGFGNSPHVLESNKHQGVIIPKNFTFSYRQERVTANSPCNNGTTATEEEVWVKVENAAAVRPAPAKRVRPKTPRSRGPQPLSATAAISASLKGAGRTSRGTKKRVGPPLERSQQRERHNSKERERRRRIRFCCDELNLLVPFCSDNTDKVTTLQWTNAYLKYIRELYGDSLKQEFQSTFCGTTGLRLKPSSSSSLGHREALEALSAPQAVEQ